eukprot:jgi/Tetstr1/438374/TSEL_026940.t1
MCTQETSALEAASSDVRAVAVVRDAEGDKRFALRQAPSAEIPDLPELGKDLRPILSSHGTTPSGDAVATSHWAEMQGETGARVRFHPD